MSYEYIYIYYVAIYTDNGPRHGLKAPVAPVPPAPVRAWRAAVHEPRRSQT